ncbi:MAG TPA: hypothetical protein PK529_08010, partial [Verrucomicrobiales bacterium]|nr:hypothetical protein [Verrucomicrobiales bacterium]
MNPVAAQPSFSASALFRSGFSCVLALCLQTGAMAAEPWWDRINPSELAPANAAVESVIDQYVDAGLAKRQVSPAPEAPPETRLRRLMLD